MRLSRTTVVPAALLLAKAFAREESEPPAYHTFQSRPDLRPPVLNVNITSDAVEPGYIFMAPYRTEYNQNSAVIYDTDGNIVWTSFTQTAQNVVYDFRPCQYNSSTHLCMVEGQQNLGYSRGHISVYDSSLTQIAQVTSQNGHAGFDQHECGLAYNNTATIGIVYNAEMTDLTSQNITSGPGYIQNTIFQKIDVESNALLFEWSAFEHIPLTQSLVPPDTTEVVGTGFSPDSPWDYFHLNSIDEDSEGSYLISARHVNALYKINGTTGTVIWSLGGTDSDFIFSPSPTTFNFSSQHDARWLESNATHDIISLFDNASNSFNRTAPISSGMIISLDHTTTPSPTASLLHSFPQPAGYPLSDSQGNMQLLTSPNPLSRNLTSTWRTSNVFIGWGNVPIVTEHLPSGEIIFQANVEINPNGMMNYRAYKIPKAALTLELRDMPALFTYALTTTDHESTTTVFYMSWNGATAITSWRILAKRSACDEEWVEIGVADRNGQFETKHRAAGYFAWGMVEALDEEGRGVRNSTLKGVRTFVPSEVLREKGGCGEEGCDGVAEGYDEEERGGEGQQVNMVQTMREACVVTPREMQEERERVEMLRAERAGGGEGEGEGGAEESAGIKYELQTWLMGVVAMVGLLYL